MLGGSNAALIAAPTAHKIRHGYASKILIKLKNCAICSTHVSQYALNYPQRLAYLYQRKDLSNHANFEVLQTKYYKSKMKFIVITGPPYSGKGTQCDELIKDHNLTHISTGEHIRREKEENTKLGKIMSDYDEKGELVPDQIMKQLLDKLIEENINSSGIILDGYPRTIPQVHDLVSVLNAKNLSIDNIINIEVPTDELLKRAKKRAETSTREDDKNPETHYKRIKVFEEQTKPTIEYMKTEFDMDTFDGLGKIEEITKRIKACI